MVAKNKNQRLPVLAIDVGGTKIIAAIISNNGKIMAKERFPTYAAKGPQYVIKRLLSAIDKLLSLQNIGLSQLDSISIAAAGAIDTNKGIITESPNLAGWSDIPLRDIVTEKYHINTFLLNDASAAALGEHRFGAGRGTNNLIFITVSTGIGGGIIIDGKLYAGTSGSAGEIGHMTIDVNGPKCTCGNTGCLETLASGTAVARDAIGRVRQGEKSTLTEMVKGNLEEITAEKVGIAAQSGDPLSMDVISGAANYLGVGMANIVNIFNPEIIVVGGGMAKLGDFLLDPVRQIVKERAFPISAQAVRIVTARLGDDAGIYGAAVFAFENSTAG